MAYLDALIEHGVYYWQLRTRLVDLAERKLVAGSAIVARLAAEAGVPWVELNDPPAVGTVVTEATSHELRGLVIWKVLYQGEVLAVIQVHLDGTETGRTHVGIGGDGTRHGWTDPANETQAAMAIANAAAVIDAARVSGAISVPIVTPQACTNGSTST